MIFAGGISGQDVSGGLPAFSLGDGRLNLVAEEARHGGPVEDHTERRQHPRSGSQHAQRLETSQLVRGEREVGGFALTPGGQAVPLGFDSVFELVDLSAESGSEVLLGGDVGHVVLLLEVGGMPDASDI